jgi:hypothetical protein
MNPRKSSTLKNLDKKELPKTKKGDILDKIYNDPDWIFSKKNDNSLQKIINKYPDGCPDRIISSVLRMSVEELNLKYQNIVLKLRTTLGVKDDD